ncbi:reverse transcriptase [Gossypium australe]|uniref:Reverse transcriptase n=1 Tax=Gossypium australe TaxID=47621 RepID=A0A5B6VWB9_9ROSI|nr:reverse transcriptase [Gossypium australe]
MSEFQTTLEDCGLSDLGFNGRWYTWERGRFSSTNIWEKLDRGVANLEWLIGGAFDPLNFGPLPGSIGHKGKNSG